MEIVNLSSDESAVVTATDFRKADLGKVLISQSIRQSIFPLAHHQSTVSGFSSRVVVPAFGEHPKMVISVAVMSKDRFIFYSA